MKVPVCAPFKDANRSDYRQARIEGQGNGRKEGRRERRDDDTVDTFDEWYRARGR